MKALVCTVINDPAGTLRGLEYFFLGTERVDFAFSPNTRQLAQRMLMTFPAIAKDPKTADIHKKISNQGFHYHGSAKFFAQAGKAFAEALVDLKKP